MIIITGASKGIGKYLKTCFEEAGETVYGTCNSTTTNTSAKETGLYKVDIADPLQVGSFFQSIKWTDADDKIVLINCAGANYSAMAHKANIADWGKVIDINVKGTFNVIHAFLPKMRENQFGRIINFSSVVAQLGIVGTSCYAASKAALWGLSKSICIENAKYNITINNLNLGYFDIGMIQEVPADALSLIKNRIPSGHLGEPKDIYKTIRYLMEIKYANGISIDLNGGLY